MSSTAFYGSSPEKGRPFMSVDTPWPDRVGINHPGAIYSLSGTPQPNQARIAVGILTH